MKLINEHLDKIKILSYEINHNITIMEICGGHTNVIMKYGLRDLLPSNIKLISGPGCPVCVSSQYDIDCMIELAKNKIPVATYGDMLKVPGSNDCLDDIRSQGGKIFEVYSATEVLKLKKNHQDIVFFGVGFETTAPMTAFLLKNNVTIYSVHKLVPPAIKILIEGDVNIDGFINPGHVSTIIGTNAYHDIKIPQVIAGFNAEQILRSIVFLLELIKEKKKIVVNAYVEAVNDTGNLVAQKLLSQQFKIVDSKWRGLGTLPLSGLEVRNDELNAKIKYEKILLNVKEPPKTACKCGEILKGIIEPIDCSLYRNVCNPDNPQGACMVSEEGSCAISYRYGK